jgi:hypothetical protein
MEYLHDTPHDTPKYSMIDAASRHRGIAASRQC